MKKPSLLLSTLCALSLSTVAAVAEEGVDRAVGGAADTVTSPAKVVEGIAEGAEKDGPVGVVTGSVKGGVEAAGQAVKGAANVGVGVIEAVTEPLRD